MATLYKTDGSTQVVFPKGKQFSLQELYALTNCGYVQAVPLHGTDGESIWMDEEGKYNGRQERNMRATAEFGRYLLPGDFLMGPVLHTSAGEVD